VHGTRYTVHSTLSQYTVHGTQHTVHTTQHSYKVHSTQLTVRSTQYTAHLHSTEYKVHSTRHTVDGTQHAYTVHSKQYTVHSTQHTVDGTQHTYKVHSIQHTYTAQYTVYSTLIQCTVQYFVKLVTSLAFFLVCLILNKKQWCLRNVGKHLRTRRHVPQAVNSHCYVSPKYRIVVVPYKLRCELLCHNLVQV